MSFFFISFAQVVSIQRIRVLSQSHVYVLCLFYFIGNLLGCFSWTFQRGKQTTCSLSEMSGIWTLVLRVHREKKVPLSTIQDNRVKKEAKREREQSCRWKWVTLGNKIFMYIIRGLNNCCFLFYTWLIISINCISIHLCHTLNNPPLLYYKVTILSAAMVYW